MEQSSWETYRDLIYFVLGTERARALWEICSVYFIPEFVKMVGGMIANTETTDLWDRLAEIRQRRIRQRPRTALDKVFSFRPHLFQARHRWASPI